MDLFTDGQRCERGVGGERRGEGVMDSGADGVVRIGWNGAQRGEVCARERPQPSHWVPNENESPAVFPKID